MTFFEVLDSRPENKYRVRTAHVVQSASRFHVKALSVLNAEGGTIALSTRGEQHELDLRHMCSSGHFNELMSGLVVYSASSGQVCVELKPLLDCVGAARPDLRPTLLHGGVVDGDDADGAENDMMLDALDIMDDIFVDAADAPPDAGALAVQAAAHAGGLEVAA